MPDEDPTPQTPPPDPEGSVEKALDDAQAIVEDTQAQVDSANADAPKGEPDAFAMPEFTAAEPNANPASIDLLSDVNLNVKIELGRTRLLVEDVLKLGEGAVVELDKLAGDPVDIYVNERHVARGEVLVLNDNFCIRVSEILDGIGEAAREASGAA
jgi:flagellar motor switch protein FliN/FliY